MRRKAFTNMYIYTEITCNKKLTAFMLLVRLKKNAGFQESKNIDYKAANLNFFN